MEENTVCDIARSRHRLILLVRLSWTALVLVFGVFVVGFLITAIVFFLRASWLPAALTTLGTLVTGAGTKFVQGARDKAVKEEEKAYRDVVKACGPKAGDQQRLEFSVTSLLATSRQARSRAVIEADATSPASDAFEQETREFREERRAYESRHGAKAGEDTGVDGTETNEESQKGEPESREQGG